MNTADAQPDPDPLPSSHEAHEARRAQKLTGAQQIPSPQQMDQAQQAPIPGLVHHWTYAAEALPRWRYRELIETFAKGVRMRPAWRRIRPVTPHPAWAVYFIYAPDGRLTAAHEFTLGRLREAGLAIVVVCASGGGAVPEAVHRHADAVFWKDLPGYDFSGYGLALREIARRSPGADVLVMNDSVYGPFTDMRALLATAPWDLTGFTASSQLQKHVQSYAFILKNVTRARMRRLASVFLPNCAFHTPRDVILIQETRLARVASKTMSVGAHWYADAAEVLDPSLMRPLELLAHGFPFVKRSLLEKYRRFQDPQQIAEALRMRGHPVEAQEE